MKKLIALPILCAALVGCGGGIPSECETTLKEYDNIIAQMDKAPGAAQMKPQLVEARKLLETQIKQLNNDQAVAACKSANESFAQLKQMLPKS